MRGGALLAVWYSARIRDWSVMTDELQYAKLALAVWESGSPLPSLHGTSVAVANQLYPLLLTPVYGPLASPDAFRVAHVVNAVVMASAAVPAYLLARELLDRAWAFAVAVLAVVLPWMVLVGFLMSEVVGYPAFLWAVLAFQRAVVAPSDRRDALAAAALVVAILARTQFTALALVLPLAIVIDELAAHGRRGRAVCAGRSARACGAPWDTTGRCGPCTRSGQSLRWRSCSRDDALSARTRRPWRAAPSCRRASGGSRSSTWPSSRSAAASSPSCSAAVGCSGPS